MALQFTAKHADKLRYVAATGKWYLWDGTRWKKEDTLKAFDLARIICRETSGFCHKEGLSRRIASAGTVAAIEKLARADRRHAASVEQWDAGLWLLNTPSGTVDLRSGAVKPHRPEDYITKITAVGPAPGCPQWLAFLRRVTGESEELQSFLRRVAGYCLTGSTREHALFFLYGPGANGKSVFMNTLSEVGGEYSRVASMDTFMASNGDRHPTDIAGLQGARLVIAIETEEGRKWAESRLKMLTGGDTVSARFMRQDFFDFKPQFKLVIAGNHKPGLRTVDEAIRRRLHLVPFTVTIPEHERDPDLALKLREEWPGILSWAIEGCLLWQQSGLDPPAIVRAATEEYLDAEDTLARWMEDRAVFGSEYLTSTSLLYQDWNRWCMECGEISGSLREFSLRLERYPALSKQRTNKLRGFRGIALKYGPSGRA